jgi:alcohol dehydrogenase
MKAAQIKEYGTVENIEIVDIEKPEPSAGQVQVEVYAASLNPVDTSFRQGHTRQMADIPLPATLAGDIAGKISALGEGVTTFAIGDMVYGTALALMGSSGALAEFAVTGADRVTATPSNVSMNEAAALPLVGVSALQALTEHMDLAPGSKLFIHGASGGIGIAAVQIAKNLGVYVAGATKGSQIQAVTKAGADLAIDVETQDYTEMLKDYDAVLALVYGEDWDKLLAVLKPGGVAVSLIGPADETITAAHNATVVPQMTGTNTTRLNSLRDLVESGIVTPQVAYTFQFDQVQAAFSKREGGGVSGKVVIEIKQ